MLRKLFKILHSAGGTEDITDEKLRAAVEEAKAYIHRDVAAGFESEDHILRNTLEVLSDQCEADLLRPHVKRLLREATRSHHREQASWPARTDCDRLDAAFAELESQGIVARQHFACCGNCGHAEIGDEMEKTARRGIDVIGYTFYHMQNTESAVEGGGLYLGYGAVDAGETPMLDIASKIVTALQKHGLAAEWDGSVKRNILVKLDWKKRRSR